MSSQSQETETQETQTQEQTQELFEDLFKELFEESIEESIEDSIELCIFCNVKLNYGFDENEMLHCQLCHNIWDGNAQCNC